MKCTHRWDKVIERDPAMSLYIRIEKARGKTEITYTSLTLDPPGFPDCQIVHLDGTVYEPEIPEMFSEDINRVDAQTHLNTTWKVHIMISRGKFKVKKLGKKQKKQDLERLMEHLRPEDEEVLLITYKDEEKQLLAAARELRPDLTFGVIYFWGPRGINAYEDYDACLVYGTPTVNAAAVEDLASALFSEQEDMDKWKASLGRRDLTQAIHRIRPVNGGKNIVVMGSFWPTEYLGYPDEKIDLMRKGSNVEEAKRRLTDFALEYGFMDRPVANMLCVGAKTDRNAIEAWQAMLSGTQGGQSDRVPTLIKILYKSGYPVEETPPCHIFT